MPLLPHGWTQLNHINEVYLREQHEDALDGQWSLRKMKLTIAVEIWSRSPLFVDQP